jgi:membrane associated rhomboid family serine protease
VRAPRTIAGARRSGNVIVTPVLIAINVAVFALTAIQSGHPVPDATSSLYLDWLLVPSWFHAGEWWRLFSYGFLHASLPHLGLNMLALYILGRDLEPVFGRLRFTALYLVSQLGGGVAIYVFGEPNRPVVGASGAVYGLLGALLVAVLRLKLNPGYALGVIGLNLVLSVTVPGISLLGHVGGLVTGAAVAAGLIYVPGQRRNLWQAFAVTGAVVVLIGLVLVHAAQFG